MADTRTLARLLDEIERADGKLILVGDPEQLPSVGAGGLFRVIIERTCATRLTENRRQHDVAEREALAALRDGRGHDYVDWATREGRLVVAPNAIAARTRLLTDWWEHAQRDPAVNIVIALRRRDVAILNALARVLMQQHGKLGERLATGDHEFAVGDRIVCTRNDDHLGIQNGTRGTVQAVNPARGELSVLMSDGTHVLLSASYFAHGNVRHGYAVTGHAAQGATVERAFVLGETDRALKEWAYVGLSRAADATTIYLGDLDEATARDPDEIRTRSATHSADHSQSNSQAKSRCKN
jgi:ATP-dependent exoDNAse (exonuclease V) alpha subunit